MHGHEQARGLGILDAQELALDSTQRQIDEAAVDPDPVFDVDQRVAGGELGEGLDFGPLGPAGPGAPFLPGTENFLFGDDRELLERKCEAFGERSRPHLDAPGTRPPPHGSRLLGRAGLDSVLREEGAQALGARERRGGEHDAPAVAAPLLEQLDERGEGAVGAAGLDELPPQLVKAIGAEGEALRTIVRRRYVEAFEPHRSPRLDLRIELIRRNQQLVGRRDEPSARHGEVEAVNRVGGVARESIETRLGVIDDDERVRGKEIEHGFETRLEDRRQSLRSRRCVASQQRVHQRIHRTGVDVLGGGEIAEGGGAFDDQGTIEQELARRRCHRVGQAGLGPLARRVELTDRLDLVAQQLDPERVLSLGREQVENAPAHGQFSGLFHQGHARVTRGDQRLYQGVAIDRLPHLEMDRPRAHGFAGGNPRSEGGPRRHHDRGGVGRNQGSDSRGSSSLAFGREGSEVGLWADFHAR